MVVLQLVVNAWSEINVAAIDGCDGGLGVVEGRESLFDLVLKLRQMQQTGVGARGLHVFGNRRHAVVGAQRDNVISVADFLI